MIWCGPRSLRPLLSFPSKLSYQLFKASLVKDVMKRSACLVYGDDIAKYSFIFVGKISASEF